MQPAERVYEEFEPPFDWAHDESSDTLILMLPGFRKEQLRVQIASTRVLRLSGERQIGDKKWRQFRKQFSIPSESDTNGVSAKFESGMLYVKLPKLIKPTQPPTPTTTPPPTAPQKAPKPPQQPKPPQAQPNAQPPRANEQKPLEKASEANIQKTNKPPPAPTPTAPHQEPKAEEDSQKNPNLVQKAAEAKPEKKEPIPMASLQEPKKEVNDSQKEKGKSEATSSKAEGVHEAKIVKRSETLEMLSRQTQEYKNAVSDLVEDLKKQKKLAKLVVVISLVLVIGLYIKNAIKSSFGRRPKIEEL
ncbi:unnamed protein product [Lupinus luteus]|uniref:SHSP domain-containing protein n=1 Tax=Lupinus luteus TaxID=3873 RepID=A0AAV1WES2_LUPLU